MCYQADVCVMEDIDDLHEGVEEGGGVRVEREAPTLKGEF